MIEIKANANFIYKEQLGTPFVFLDHNKKMLFDKSTDKIVTSILKDQYEIWTKADRTWLVTIFWWEE